MKLLKRSLVLLGCALAAAAAFTACELGLGDNDDRLATNQDAVSKIEVTGQTTTFIKGADFSLGNGVVTATYVNSTTAVVTDKVVQSGFNSDTVSDDVTVTLSYTEDGRTVSTSYEVSIILPVKEIKVTKEPTKKTYDLYIQNVPLLDLTGLEVTAIYEDDSETVVPVDQLQVSVPTKQGDNELTITYAEKTDIITVSVLIFYENESAAGSGYIPMKMCGYTGKQEITTFFETKSTPVEVSVDSAVQTVFTVDKVDRGQNYFTPTYAITKADPYAGGKYDGTTEIAVCRTDHFGWGSSYENNDNKKLDSDWDWDTFHDDVEGSTEYVTVVNNGSTIDLYLHFVKDGAVIHHQYYIGLTGTKDSVYFFITGENTTITFTE